MVNSLLTIVSYKIHFLNMIYLKGIWAPREWPGLPPVDSVSRIFQDVDYPDNQLTITVMHWGQLVAHDITHVPTFRTCKLIHISFV